MVKSWGSPINDLFGFFLGRGAEFSSTSTLAKVLFVVDVEAVALMERASTGSWYNCGEVRD